MKSTLRQIANKHAPFGAFCFCTYHAPPRSSGFGHAVDLMMFDREPRLRKAGWLRQNFRSGATLNTHPVKNNIVSHKSR